MTWRHHIERTVAKAMRTYVRTYSLFKSGCLSTNSKLTLYKALIRSVMTYACPTWEYAADAHLLKFQRLQIRALSLQHILTGANHSANCAWFSKFFTCYDCITKLCRTQGEVFLNHGNPSVRGTGQREARRRMNTRKYWVFGLCPSSSIPKTREDSVSESGSVSILW
jgi:hypothetical protein